MFGSWEEESSPLLFQYSSPRNATPCWVTSFALISGSQGLHAKQEAWLAVFHDLTQFSLTHYLCSLALKLSSLSSLVELI